MDLLTKLGVDWRLLIGQIINFLIVLAILYKFVYHPLLNMLKRREDKIAKSLEDVKKIEKNLQNSEAQKKEIMAQARQEAENVVKKAETAAEQLKIELTQKAKAEAEKISAETKKQLEDEKNKMLQEIKKQTADLVIAATEKMLGEKLTEKKDRELIEESIQSIKF